MCIFELYEYKMSLNPNDNLVIMYIQNHSRIRHFPSFMQFQSKFTFFSQINHINATKLYTYIQYYSETILPSLYACSNFFKSQTFSCSLFPLSVSATVILFVTRSTICLWEWISLPSFTAFSTDSKGS